MKVETVESGEQDLLKARTLKLPEGRYYQGNLCRDSSEDGTRTSASL